MKAIKLFTFIIFCGIIVLLASIDRIENGAAHPVLVFGSIAAVFGFAFAVSEVIDMMKKRRI